MFKYVKSLNGIWQVDNSRPSQHFSVGGGAEAELKRILYNNQKLDEVMPIFVQKCQLLLILLAALWNKISMTWKITLRVWKSTTNFTQCGNLKRFLIRILWASQMIKMALVLSRMYVNWQDWFHGFHVKILGVEKF